jgi:hypothetical protein
VKTIASDGQRVGPSWARILACAVTVLFLGAALGACAAGRGDDPAALPLFDGRSLAGWEQRGGSAAYFVEDGAIVGETRPSQPNSFLCTARSYADFELDLEFLVDAALNSGVQIRSASRTEGSREIVYGYQIEIDPSARAWTGGLYDESRRGWLADLAANPEARAAFRPGQWNHLRIRAEGPHIRSWLNGVAAADFTDDMSSEGFIALQVHGVGARTDPLRIRWRALSLREIGASGP